MGELATPLPDLILGGEEAVHGALRAEVAALVQKGGPDLGRGGVQEALAVKTGEDRLALGLAERPLRLGPRSRGAGLRWPAATVDGGRRDA